MTVSSATVNVPVRGDVAALAAIENATAPLPLPLAPDVIVSQEALLVAVHVQPIVVVTLALFEPAVAGGLSEVGETVNVQGAGAPAWITVTVWPAMVSVPVREAVTGLAAIENATVPLPLPLAPAVMPNQEALLVAVQTHPPAVVTLALPEPAVAAAFSEVGDTV